MKIGVTTFLNTKTNYGQVLQAFALQRVLKNFGHEAFVIKENINGFPTWLRIKGWIEKLLSPQKFILGLKAKRKPASQIHEETHDRQFATFITNHITVWPHTYKDAKDMKDNAPDLDTLITGSDQVWNMYMTKEKHSFYLLQFGSKDCKRISYAASFGRDNLFFYEKGYFRKALSEYQLVSVRESTGKSICDSININSTIVADPVALLRKEDWLTLAYKDYTVVEKATKHNNRIFAYMIANSKGESSIISPLIQKFKNEGGNISYVSASRFHDSLSNCWPTIPEWICAINESSIVITDSFHCTLFSIILNTPFIVVPREGSSCAMNNRITTLLEVCGLSDRFILEYNKNSIDKIYNSDINWDSVNLKLQSYRENSLSILEKALNQ